MRKQLSQTLGIALSQVSVKASTSDQLGSIGRGEGIAAYAIALIQGVSANSRFRSQIQAFKCNESVCLATAVGGSRIGEQSG